ncbi:Hsp70 family protein [Frankia sp. AgPm24]|uniref:Hsp70 family protein n=1 Tax=Frankia sp. AgPm24 TaxID=631128 RepID=UPI00200D3618|nr:Hsp70 family protein [Frankia sp. AgPm24]MCK9924117.1 Hsp70 family protein [Frankia sp. AgPm24]
MAGTKVFGIDLGTTYSCIAQVDEYGRPDVIRNIESQPTTPSVVLFDEGTEGETSFVVGTQAKRQARIRPDDVARLVKRHMGTSDWRFVAHDVEYSAAAVSSLVLKALVADAERAAGVPVTDVVITVPAYFGDEERKATKLAGELAGLNVVDIINEPTAAAFAYGFGQEGAQESTVLVYDLGGGTFDTTVIRLSEGAITVVATDGDHELGGADWDNELVRYLAQKFTEAEPTAGDPLDDVYDEQELLSAAEDAKLALSGRDSVDVLVVHKGHRVSVPVTRATFEEITGPLLRRTLELTGSVLARAREKGVEQIDLCLLVGGMSKTPMVGRGLQESFGLTSRLVDPDLAVAKGAAVYGQKKALELAVHSDLVASGALRPDQDLAAAQDADVERAAAASADEAGLAAASVVDLVRTKVTNVTSRGFGIFAEDRGVPVAAFLAHQNDPLPISVVRTFYTVTDDQAEVDIRVFEQGTTTESKEIEDNKVIVAGAITGIPPGHQRGTPVEVTFAMAGDQTIRVTASHEGAATPLVLQVEAGVGSDRMRATESAKVSLLKRRD